ncbi:MAG: hypothetical protein E7316_04350 [Clostridiales bacterium]|nr:hypothetical protein [Clostridiales bacterium]
MMNLERELVFCFIEEDNIQRAYFRVRPLLTISGDVQEEARRLWPDDGCLRIVPDRNEQHTFKDRMRTLGGYCMMNLQGIPADANKIRTNKNYKPDKGETNQFILYSDTVHALPEHTFFEVLEGSPAEYAALAEKALTPLFYIRENDTIYGPVRKAEPAQPATAEETAGVLYPLACPDGAERVMLCIEQPVPVKPAAPAPVPAPAPTPTPQDEALPIGKPLQILDKGKDFEETLHSLDQPLSKSANLLHQESKLEDAIAAPAESKPLSGTPLYRAPMRTAVPQPKNKLQEVVSAQWRVARNEPHTAPLPAGATMRQVENPVEVACTSMQAAWQVPEAQTQLIDFLLSLDGMRAKLEPRMSESPDDTPLQKTLKSRLDDMEAERLAALLQLDKAKADLDAYRRSIIEGMSAKSKEDVTRLEALKAEHEAAIAALRKQQNALIAQRDELTRRVDELQHTELPAALAKAMADAQIAAPVAGTPLHLRPIGGESIATTELIRRVMDTFAASGLNLHRNHAVAALATLTICPRIGVTSVTPAAAATLVSNLALRLGWASSFAHQVTPEQKPVLDSRPANGTPAILLTSLAAYAPLENITKVFTARNVMNQTHSTAYEASSWPIFPLPALPFIPQLKAGVLAPVSAAALKAFASSASVSMDEILQILENVLKLIAPLSGSALSELHQFVSACTPLMDGGLAAAMDWAILLWIIPAMERNTRTIAAMKPLLEEYPLSLAALQA